MSAVRFCVQKLTSIEALVSLFYSHTSYTKMWFVSKWLVEIINYYIFLIMNSVSDGISCLMITKRLLVINALLIFVSNDRIVYLHINMP